METKHTMKQPDELPQEIQWYHEAVCERAEVEMRIKKLNDTIVAMHSPFKVGDKVEFITSYSGQKVRYGVIRRVSFGGVSLGYIDNKWIVEITPTTKKFSRIKRTVVYPVVLKNEGDRIIRIIK